MQSPAKNPSRLPAWLLAALLVLITVALYWPATSNGFVNLDDPEYVTANAHVQAGLTWENLQWACQNTVCCNWHPLTVLSHMLDCQLFDLKPWGPHLTNLLLHALNAGLVFVLLRMTTGATWRSLLVAALFALHPLRVESVAWVAERKDVLSGLFGLLALIAYARYAAKAGGASPKAEVRRPKEGRNPKADNTAPLGVPGSMFDVRRSMFDVRSSCLRSPIFYLLSLFFFACGLMSKPMLVTLPFVLLLLDYWPLRRMQKTEDSAPQRSSRFMFHLSLLLEKLPFLALAALASLVTLLVQRRAMTAAESLPLGARLGNALISYGRYLGKLFWPVDLAVWYPHPGHWPVGTILLAGVALLAITALVWVQRKRFPYLLVGWLWFIGTLVPVIGLVQVGAQAMADRYTYLPSLGVLILVVWATGDLTSRWRYRTPALAAASGAAILLCLVLTRQQLGYWKDSQILFEHAIAVTTDNWLAHINLGIALHDQGQLDQALAHFEQAVHLRPNHADAYSNFGVALDDQGHTADAIRQFQKALQLRPNHPDAHYNLACALAKQGKTAGAITQFQEAIRLKPDNPNAYNNLGLALARQGQTDDAIRQFQAALRLNPRHPDAHLNLGDAFAAKGQVDQAIGQFQETVRLKPDYAQAHYNLGIVLSLKSRPEAAISQLREAIRLQPAYPEALGALASMLDGQGNYAEAVQFYQAALNLRPDQPAILNNLAWRLASCPDAAVRNGPEAVRFALRACELTAYAQPWLIGTLGAAQAEAGDFHAAVATAERAATLATSLHLEAVAAKNRELLQLYRQGQPFHEAQKTTTTDEHR